MPYNNIPKDNLSFTLGIFSFLPLGQGAPRNAIHATRIEPRVWGSKAYNVCNPKSIERGRVKIPATMTDNEVKQYGDKLRIKGTGTFRSLGIDTREALTKVTKPADGICKNSAAQSNESGKTRRIPVNKNRSRMPRTSLNLFSARAKGSLLTSNAPYNCI
jgi:hypothetical protein